MMSSSKCKKLKFALGSLDTHYLDGYLAAYCSVRMVENHYVMTSGNCYSRLLKK